MWQVPVVGVSYRNFLRPFLAACVLLADVPHLV